MELPFQKEQSLQYQSGCSSEVHFIGKILRCLILTGNYKVASGLIRFGRVNLTGMYTTKFKPPNLNFSHTANMIHLTNL